MSGVFLDTSGLVAVVNVDDHWHSVASVVWEQLMRDGRQMVTTSLVLIELGDGLSRVQQRQLAVRVREGLIQADCVEVVQVGAQEEQRAWDLYARRSDKQWGMTDCVSMVVMEDRGIRTVITADRHFEQAGYEKLLNT